VRHEVALEFDYSDVFPATLIAAAQPGYDMRDLCVSVQNAFNAAARLSIGTSNEPELIVAESDVRMSVAGDYSIPRTWVAPPSVTTTIYLFVNPGAATSGIFRVYFSTGVVPDLGGPP
jgi:hypothetical protein